jgi:polyisoprenoid-binding protein YceI
MRKESVLLFGLITFVGLAGCAADPAADKPDAAVSEAQPLTESTAGGALLAFSEGSTITWVGSKVTGTHEGGFKDFDGEINLVNDDPTASSVTVTIDTTTLWSDDERLTGHLKSADFFDVETYPTATFISTSIQAAESGYTVTGNLDLHGIEKSISFPAEITVADGSATINASFAVKRFDFGIVYPGKKDDLIRDEVALTLDLRAAAR